MSLDEEAFRSRVLDRVIHAGYSTFVETGTAVGNTTDWAAPYFERLITIEYADDLYRAAAIRLLPHDNIRVFHGDSADILENIIPRIETPTFYFLDAHSVEDYHEDAPSGPCPLVAELHHIAHATQPHMVAIDDIRLLDYWNIPPAKLKQHFETYNYTQEIDGDIWWAWGGY